jgi:hypothetical protein
MLLVTHPMALATMNLSGAIETLFERFRANPRAATQWIDRVLDRDLTDEEIAVEIRAAVAEHCPGLSGEAVDRLVDILTQAVRSASRRL